MSVFHIKVAKALGLEKSHGKPMDVTVGDGDRMHILLYNLRVRFSNLGFMAHIGFSEELRVGFNIIGRASFFERFRVCFNDRDRVVTTLRLF